MFPTRNISEELRKEAENYQRQTQALEDFVKELFTDSRGRKLRKVGCHSEKSVRIMLGLDNKFTH
jgi:hypothetical protein